MANQWFKLFGGEFMSDTKILTLSGSERSCWVTLLCWASMNSYDGVLRNIDEEVLMAQSGILKSVDEEWDHAVGVLKKFEKLGLIRTDESDGTVTIVNWKKRQEIILTGAERAKLWRERQKESNGDVTDSNESVQNSNARVEENRIEKKRIEYLDRVPEEDIKEFMGRFVVTEKDIKSKAEDLKLYCQRKGKKYSNYKAFLLNAIKRDHKERDGSAKGGKYSNI